MKFTPLGTIPKGTRHWRSHAACCAVALLASFAGASGASAASCTNTLSPSNATPGGFGAAYNVFTAGKELLIQGTECTSNAAQISVGSGSAEQYVYKNALYWNGSAWQELPLSGSSLVSDTWYAGKATASMPVGSDAPRYVLGYVCQRDDGKWKCGCSDDACTTSSWQLQGVQAPPAPPPPTGGSGTGVCAAGTQPPPQAAAVGLTKLAFCDDFSTDTVARGDTAEARDITAGKKWTTERAAGWGGTPDPASAFKFNSDGTLTVQPKYGTYNWFMSSTALRNGGLKGFWIDKKTKWYAEIRWKFQKGSSTSQQPAFWSMDACHLYGKPAGCKNGYYIEPDFWEYYFGVWAAHYYKEVSGDQTLSRCNDQNRAHGVSENQWFTAGTLVTDVPEMKYFKNDQLVFARKTSSPCDAHNGSGLNSAKWISELKNGDYPILVGSKPGEIITIDYVRVWLAQ